MIRIYGHRGARGERPENGLAGFYHAKAVGAAGIETDVAVTADLVAVLRHDPELPDGRAIRDLAAAMLPDVPTLREALAAVPGIDWLLEIKTYPPTPGRSQPPAVMVRAVLAAIAAAGADAARISILAFDWAVLAEVARQAPALRRVCLTAPEAAPALWWGEAASRLPAPRAVASIGASAWAPHHAGLSAAAVAEAHDLGLLVIPWTVNEPADVDRLAPLVDGIITDFPGRFTMRPPTPPAAG